MGRPLWGRPLLAAFPPALWLKWRPAFPLVRRWHLLVSPAPIALANGRSLSGLEPVPWESGIGSLEGGFVQCFVLSCDLLMLAGLIRSHSALTDGKPFWNRCQYQHGHRLWDRDGPLWTTQYRIWCRRLGRWAGSDEAPLVWGRPCYPLIATRTGPGPGPWKGLVSHPVNQLL